MSRTGVASVNTLGSRRKSSESHAAKHSEGPDSPLDFDVDAASLPASCDDVTIHATAGPGRKRRLERAESSLPGTLTGPALLHWLKRRRCARQGDEVEVTVSRSGDRRRGEKCLQEQVLFFKDLQSDLEEVFLLPPPEMITSLRCTSRKTQKLAKSDSFMTLLSSTRLLSNPTVAAQATDQWEVIQKNMVTEAAKAFTRSKVARVRSTVTFPWRNHEILQEALDLECALQMLQDRCDLEAGRRVLMRRNGAQPKAGLFEDPAQGSSEASSAAAAVQAGCLPAMATGNEFEAATFLKKTELAQLLRKARPGVLGTWHRIQASRALGFQDILHCMWSARQNALGISGYFVGRMTQAGLTTRSFAGGQEHCCCSCGQWLTRSNFKGHSCEHVGKPHDSKLKLFWQNRGILAFRTSFKHHSNPSAIDLTLEANLESAIQSLLWSDFWSSQVACSWRLCGDTSVEREVKCTVKPPCCEVVPAGHSLTPQQLVLLGWMRSQEARDGYTSRQVLREDLCEANRLVSWDQETYILEICKYVGRLKVRDHEKPATIPFPVNS